MSPFIIAELSANHGASLDIALESLEAIAQSGADAIKLQTYRPGCLTLPFRNEYFRIKDGLWKDRYLWDLYEEAQTPWEWHKPIFNRAKELGIVAFSSPFSVKGVEFLENLDCPIYKVASFEIAHIQMLEAIASAKKPVILSLGIANDKEIENAMNILKDNEKITPLYCISAYPARIEDAKLSNIDKIRRRWAGYNAEVGISDHTLGITIPIAATLCGASVIEKHLILDKSISSPDREFSLDKNELKSMVKHVREASLLSDIRLTSRQTCFNEDLKADLDSEAKPGREFARSLFISRDVKQGEIIDSSNIACARPNYGLSPLRLKDVLGKRFSQARSGGSPLTLEDIENL